jgi:adenylate kinase family enzyme
MIIFLSGSINSGKTTIANLLKKEFPRTTHIEVDDLRAMVDYMPLDESIPLNLKNTLSLTLNLLKENINIIITYPLSKDEYEFFNKHLPLEVQRFFFTLNPRLDHALTDRGTRKLTQWEVERIKHHYQTGVNNPGFGITIDNTMQSPGETVSDILYYIEQREIRYRMED